MTLKNTLQNYFNSGSPDKRAKRRIGGLIIAITAVALVAAIIVLTVSSIASAVGKKKADKGGEGEAPAIAIETVSGSKDDILANLNGKITLVDGSALTIAQTDVTTLVQTNRTNLGDEENPTYAYGCNYPSSDALLAEAFVAFDRMACDFYTNNGSTKIFVYKVYNTTNQVGATYANGLTVKLHTFEEDENGTYPNSIYGNDSYTWIYDNAANYGFVRVSNEEGYEDVFRYVGLAHAKAMGKNTVISEYIEALKATSAEAPKKVKAKTSLEEGAKSAEAFIYYVPYGESYNLPNPDKYTFSAGDIGDGYVITCYAK